MEEILKKIGQLQYEISCLELDKETLTGVTIRTQELKELVKNYNLPCVVCSYSENDMDNAYDKGLEDGLKRVKAQQLLATPDQRQGEQINSENLCLTCNTDRNFKPVLCCGYCGDPLL